MRLPVPVCFPLLIVLIPMKYKIFGNKNETALLTVLMDRLGSQSCLFFPSLPFTFICQIISDFHTSTDTQSEVAIGHGLFLVQLLPFAEALGTSVPCPGSFSQRKNQGYFSMYVGEFFQRTSWNEGLSLPVGDVFEEGVMMLVYCFASRAKPSPLSNSWCSVNSHWLDIY